MSSPQIGRKRVIGTHECGACGVTLFSARWRDTGILVHVEKGAANGDLFVVPELVGMRAVGLPHVAKATRGKVTEFREHVCPKLPPKYERPTLTYLGNVRDPAFSAANFARKRRP